jgi:hypothetical protein
LPDVESVRRLALELPDAEEGTSYGTTAWKVRKKMFARVKEDGESIVVRVDFLEREALTQSQPETFVVTDHYRDYPMVIVRLETVDREELRELLIESWRQVAPKRLLAEFDARTEPG